MINPGIKHLSRGPIRGQNTSTGGKFGLKTPQPRTSLGLNTLTGDKFGIKTSQPGTHSELKYLNREQIQGQNTSSGDKSRDKKSQGTNSRSKNRAN